MSENHGIYLFSNSMCVCIPFFSSHKIIIYFSLNFDFLISSRIFTNQWINFYIYLRLFIYRV